MKLRKLKKKHSSKQERMWIKHLMEWKQLDTEYINIKQHYMAYCKKQLGYNVVETYIPTELEIALGKT